MNTAFVTSEEIGEPVGISLRKARTRRPDRTRHALDLMGRIRTQIDSSGEVFFTNKGPNRNTKRYNYPYLPTKNRWEKGDQDQISFSFQVGKGVLDMPEKNYVRHYGRKLPPKSTVWPNNSYEEVLTSFCDAKFEATGLPLTMEQSMEVIRRSMFFFGFDSGMAHLARAMKIPTFIMAYTRKGRRNARRWHIGDHVMCEGTRDFLLKAKDFLQNERPEITWTCPNV